MRENDELWVMHRSSLSLGIRRAGIACGLHRLRYRQRLRVRTVDIPANLGVRVGMLADIHADPVLMPPWLIQQAVDAINAAGPLDAVLIPGDFVARVDGVMPEVAGALRQLHAPVFASLGNHDAGRARLHVLEALAAANVTVLVNQSVPFPDRADVWIAGLDSLRPGIPDVVQALQDVGDTARTIVMGHEPELATQHGCVMHVAGHTHHGQIRLRGLPLRYMPPGSQPYPEGLYALTDEPDGARRWVYTTAGIGSSELSLRIGCPPEIVILTL